VVVFIWAPDEEGQFEPGRCNRWWLHNSLKALSASLRKLGSQLILRTARQARPGPPPPARAGLGRVARVRARSTRLRVRRAARTGSRRKAFSGP